MPATIVTHTGVLIWESLAAALIMDALVGLGRSHVAISAGLLAATWISICAAVWR